MLTIYHITIENIKKEVVPELISTEKVVQSPFSSNPNDKKYEPNVQAVMELIIEKSLFEVEETNRGLINPFTKKKATPQQSNDLRSFRLLGEQEYYQRIAYFILKQPSVSVPNRKRCLLQVSHCCCISVATVHISLRTITNSLSRFRGSV